MKCENPKISIHESPILDRGDESSREMRVRKGECVKYLLYPSKDGKYERRFVIEEGAIFHGAGIAIGANMVLEMSVYINGNQSEAHLQILTLAQSGSSIEVHGVGKVSPGCERVKLRVDQTNILLGTGAKVRGIPVLEVATDSIEGGHSCRIHRISDEAMFYLQSHGLSRETAEGLLLEGEIGRHVAVMEEGTEEVKEEILERIKIEK